jgi:2-phospho-L-lactate/phosphoenolpyruvate guanylyltransferase
MLVAIVPVKPLSTAKSRLSDLLTMSERRALVMAMLDDVLAALGAARGIARIGVISADTTVLARAATLGADALIDSAGDLNTALVDAAGHYAALGASASLILHADVPLVTPTEIERLLASYPGPRGATIAPSRDGGTNALLVRPPLALPFRFGTNSLAQHVEAACERGLPVALVRSPGLELDVDRPDDLLRLAELDGETAAQRLARELCVCERMMCV